MSRFFVAMAIMGLLAGSALADLNLTTAGASGFINNAFFQQVGPQPTGTGYINSFVRIQATGSEQGYNTDGRPVQFDENTSPTFTRSLLRSDIPIVTIGGTEYRQFLLDINQQSNDTNPLLSLNSIKIFQAATGNITSLAALGAPIYDLDGAGNNGILLNYALNSGSGSGDMFAYIRSNLFTGPNQYVYLYSQFGTPPGTYPSNDGFEEWAVIGSTPFVPAPGAVLLAMIGLSMVGWLKRRFA